MIIFPSAGGCLPLPGLPARGEVVPVGVNRLGLLSPLTLLLAELILLGVIDLDSAADLEGGPFLGPLALFGADEDIP